MGNSKYIRLVKSLRDNDTSWNNLPQLVLSSGRNTLNLEALGNVTDTVFITDYTTPQDISDSVKIFKGSGVSQAVVLNDSTSLKSLLIALLDLGVKVAGVYRNTYTDCYNRSNVIEGIAVKF